MELVDYDIAAPSRSDVAEIVWMGDPHTGHIKCDRKLFEKQLKWVLDRNAHLILNGDLFDLIMGKDKRVDPAQVDPFFMDSGSDISKVQLKYMTEILLPLRDKIIGVHSGNHEETWRIEHYDNIIKELCENLDVPYLTYTAFIRLHFKRSGKDSRVIIARSSHGCAGGRTKGAILNHLHNLKKDFDADIYVQGHAHRRVVDITPFLGVSRSERNYKLKSTNCAFIATGSFFQTYSLGGESSYGEKRDYPPGDLGGAYVKIQPWGEGIVEVCPMLP